MEYRTRRPRCAVILGLPLPHQALMLAERCARSRSEQLRLEVPGDGFSMYCVLFRYGHSHKISLTESTQSSLSPLWHAEWLCTVRHTRVEHRLFGHRIWPLRSRTSSSGVAKSWGHLTSSGSSIFPALSIRPL